MSVSRIITGLDVGTTKVCAIVGEIIDDRLDIIGIGKAQSGGLRKGMVIDVDSTVESIRSAISDASRSAGIPVRSVSVGIAGNHIESFSSYGAVGIKGMEVSAFDIEKAIEAAKAVYVPLDREILHIIPAEYTVDGQEGISSPAGMPGVRLEARVQIITGSAGAIRGLVRCCEKAGLSVTDMVLQPMASAMAVLSDEEKNGVILVDIGGGTTDLAFYEKGVLKNTAIIPVGGNHITNDLAVGLRLPAMEAERIKREFASAFESLCSGGEIEIMVARRDKRTIPESYILEIAGPRCEELFLLLKREIDNFRGRDLASYGIVLTGGASMLRGMDTLCEAVLGMPVRIGVPEGVGGLRNMICDPAYSTGVGLALYTAETRGCQVFYSDLTTAMARAWEKMKGLVNLSGKQDDRPARQRTA